MKRILLILILTFFAILSSAQDVEMIDVVHTKSGDIIKGTIVEQVVNEYIAIESLGGSRYVLRMDEIEKITKEKVKGKSNEQTINLNNRKKANPKSYYAFTLGGGYIIDKTSKKFSLSFSVAECNFHIGKGFGIMLMQQDHMNWKNDDLLNDLNIRIGPSYAIATKACFITFAPTIGFDFIINEQHKTVINPLDPYGLYQEQTKDPGFINLGAGGHISARFFPESYYNLILSVGCDWNKQFIVPYARLGLAIKLDLLRRNQLIILY